MKATKTLRLILGDQLNSQHSWYSHNDKDVTYALFEIRSETDYALHHIQKVVGFFAAMRAFAQWLLDTDQKVIYYKIGDENNFPTFEQNLNYLIDTHNFTHFEYQQPDEYRLQETIKSFCNTLKISHQIYDSEHFMCSVQEFESFFSGKKTYLMESFYRYMRQKNDILMEGAVPINGQWNFDANNREKIPIQHLPVLPKVFENKVTDILTEIKKTNIKTIGTIDENSFLWPINRGQSLELLHFFVKDCLLHFGTFQDAMIPNGWSLYHSRISFSLNTKMVSPKEVIEAAVLEWKNRPVEITYNQVEGFVRQILGWREYMRGIYWLKMPQFATLNYFENSAELPNWFWTGKTKMNCLKHSITQSLNYAYAHHIQRLMVTGNFALLAGVHPSEVDKWYLGIYIDAIEWVEITNTRGMSQFADGGIIGTKPYISTAAYIHKQSHYCGTCYYDKDKKIGLKACPFNSLYWHFYDKNEAKLSKNPRIGMVYNTLRKMNPTAKAELLEQAKYYLQNINDL